MSKMPGLPDPIAIEFMGDRGNELYERARADYWEARCRRAVEALREAKGSICCGCSCPRCELALRHADEAIAAVGPLPEQWKP